MNKLTNFLKELVSLLITMAVMLLAMKLFFYYVAEPFIVDGRSMDTTLESGERLLMLKNNAIERFDVVVFPSPTNPNKLYIKRVIGIPGDKLEVKDDQLILNGKAMDEPYLKQKQAEIEGDFTFDFTLQNATGKEVIPEGKYFVMGDNRRNSLDSRSFGYIDSDSVIGEADVIHWPFDKMKLLSQYSLNDDGTAIIEE